MFFFLFAINQVRCVAAVREEREKEKKETALTLFAWLCRFLAISADALFFFCCIFCFPFLCFLRLSNAILSFQIADEFSLQRPA